MTRSRIEYRCIGCGAVNRIPAGRVAQDPACGRCKAKLFPGTPETVTDASFRARVIDSPLPVLVDFWAPWCDPCRSIASALEAIAAERAGQIKVAKVNVDENPGIAGELAVRSIPALKLFSGGAVVDEVVGAVPKSRLDAMIMRGAR